MNKKTKKIVLAALFAALIFLATTTLKFSFSLYGYFNMGDCVILIASWILSPSYCFFAAGIGSALADLLSGYAVYAVATFFIKGLMAVLGHFLFRFFWKRNRMLLGALCSAISSETVMVLGYFFFEAALYGPLPAAANIPGGVMQGVAGMISALLFLPFLKKNNFFFR